MSGYWFVGRDRSGVMNFRLSFRLLWLVESSVLIVVLTGLETVIFVVPDTLKSSKWYIRP